MQENIKNRKAYRICTDADNKVWDRINFLTNAMSVDANDGRTLEEKVGGIKGITTETNVTENGWAADMTTVKALNDRMGVFSFMQNPIVIALKKNNSLYKDEVSKNYILADSATGQSLLADAETYTTAKAEGNFYNTTGADTVIPFSAKPKIRHYATTAVRSGEQSDPNFSIHEYSFLADGVLYIYGDMQRHSGVTASITMKLDNKTISNSKGIECKAGQKLKVYGSYEDGAWDDAAYYFITYTYVY